MHTLLMVKQEQEHGSTI